jgi:hypothetical protein
MKKAIYALMFSLVGCATYGTDGVVTIGPNQYMIGRMGGFFDHSSSAMKAKMFAEANQFCKDKGLTMVPLNSTGRDSGIDRASAEVQFSCK